MNAKRREREREKRERVAAKERSMDRTNSCVAAVYCHRGDKQPSLRCSSLFGDSLVSFSPKQHHSTHRSSRGSLQFYTRSELARETEPLGTSARSQCLAAPPASLGKAATFHFAADLDGLCCACRPSRLRRSRCSACSPAPLCETTAAHAWSAAALRGAKWHCTLPASGARCAGAWPQNRTPHTVW